MRFLPSDMSKRRTAEAILGPGGLDRERQQQRQRQQQVSNGIRYAAPGDWPEAPTSTSAGLPAAPSIAHIALNRLAYSPRPGDVDAFNALAGGNVARLTAWVDQQLAPGSINDSARLSRENAAGFQTVHKTAQQVWNQHVVPRASLEWVDYIRPYLETERTAMLRAAYSERQLFEVMVMFWHDHFSIFGRDTGPMFLIYDRDVIRANALGNFRTLLEAVTKSNSMMFYLDLEWNSYEPYLPNDGLNENFARELLELHTLGDEHFFGNIDPSEVPLNADGDRAGYTDTDVTMAARCLTGWTIDNKPWVNGLGNTGVFRYHHPWHDDVNDKVVLGNSLTDKSVHEKDGQDLLNILASHRATAVHVCTKLCRRLVSDFPDPALVEAAADVFQSAWQDSDQIAQVVRTIVLSSDFRTTWGEKIKRPFEIAMGAIRAANADFKFDEGDYGNALTWRLFNTGHLPFNWHPPNGYPDIRFAWASTSPMVMSWSLCNWMVQANDPSGQKYIDTIGQIPANVRTPTELVDFWTDRILDRPFPSADRQALIDYVADGEDPNTPLVFGPSWNVPDRVRGIVSLIFMSPSFLWR
ncbi:MAG: DUF1800 domain-containing protein [Acidobacteriota bacterium]